jgi:hypothetical protein
LGPAGDDDTAQAEAAAGLAATPATHANPWLVGHLRRWVYLAGAPTETTSGDPVTPYELEINGDWQAAVDAWSDRGCRYDAAIAQLGGDITAVQSAMASGAARPNAPQRSLRRSCRPARTDRPAGNARYSSC